MEFKNEITEIMTKHIKSTSKIDKFEVYILGNRKDNKPDEVHYDNGEYLWFLRYPGYTCANIIFNKDKSIKEIIIVHRGGAFSPDDETIFEDPDKLEKELNKQFKGKTCNYYPSKMF